MAMTNTILKKLLDVNPEDFVILKEELQESVTGVPIYVIKVRFPKNHKDRCPICGRECPRYDRADCLTRWRTLDFHNTFTYIEGPAYRVNCPEHGPITVAVPWASRNSRFTRAFDMEAAWLARENTKSMVSEYLHIDWETVGHCVKRALSVIEPDPHCRYQNLKYIGIDETSHKKGHKYITTVVNHEKNEVVWVGIGKGYEVLSQFFDLLSDEQRASIKVVTADGADWITKCVEQYCPNAVRCMDSFHVVEWINEAMDDLRKEAFNKANAEVNRQKKSASNEAKKAVVSSIVSHYEGISNGLASNIAYFRMTENCIEAEVNRLKDQKRKITVLLSDFKAEASSLLSSARTAFKQAVELDGPACSEGIMRSVELLYLYYDAAEKISVAKAELIWIRNSINGLSLKKAEAVTTRRILSDIFRQSKKEYKNKLHEAKKKSYSFKSVEQADDITEKIHNAEAKAKLLKGSKYAFLMNPEHLYENQVTKLQLIGNSYPELYKAYQFKESIRILLHNHDVDFVRAELGIWIESVKKTGIARLVELADKIGRHQEHILNTILMQMSNARIEATNTKIKLIIRKAYGFRNLQNLISMVMLVCSDLDIPRCHRPIIGWRKGRKRRNYIGAA